MWYLGGEQGRVLGEVDLGERARALLRVMEEGRACQEYWRGVRVMGRFDELGHVAF